MKTILLPLVKASELYHLETQGRQPLFDPQDIAGSSTKATHKPRQLGAINCVYDPIVTLLQKKGSSEASPGKFLDIRRFMDQPSAAPERNMILGMAEQQGYLTKEIVYSVNYSDNSVPEKNRLTSDHLRYRDALEDAFGDEGLIEKRELLVGTEKLIKQLGITKQMAIANGPLHGSIAVFENFSKTGATGLKLDGIYWSDQHMDPRTTASFCSIFKSSEQNWNRETVPFPAYDNELEKNVSKTFYHRHDLPDNSVRREASVGMSM